MVQRSYCWHGPDGAPVGPVPAEMVASLLARGSLVPDMTLYDEAGAALGPARAVVAGAAGPDLEAALSEASLFDAASVDLSPQAPLSPEAFERSAATPSMAARVARPPEAPVAEVEAPTDDGVFDPSIDPLADEVPAPEPARAAPTRVELPPLPEGFDGRWADVDVLADEEDDPSPPAPEVLRRALEEIFHHRFAEAQELLTRHHARTREDPDASAALAYCRFRLSAAVEDKAAQLEAVEALVDANPELFHARAFAARMSLALGNKEEAMLYFDACEQLALHGGGDTATFAQLRSVFSAARATDADRRRRVRKEVVQTGPRPWLVGALAVVGLSSIGATLLGKGDLAYVLMGLVVALMVATYATQRRAER